MASAFREFDGYDHHVVLHTYPNQRNSVYAPLLGTGILTGTSTQIYSNDVHEVVLHWVTSSENAGQPWVVANDEQGSANDGILPDGDYASTNAQLSIVGKVLYGTFMAGGAGVEAYFG